MRVLTGARERAFASARVLLLIEHTTRVRHFVCGFCGSTTFFVIIINGTIFGKKKLLNIKCVVWFTLELLFETFLILRRIQQNIFINVKTSSCKVAVILIGLE
jgi:hypothetical protein